LRASKEGIGNFNLEELLLLRNNFSILDVHSELLLLLLLFLLSSLVHDLVFGLLQLVVLVVEYVFEGVSLLRAAVSLELIQHLRKLSLPNDCVLKFSHLLVSKNNVALMHA
jgi:hypothetical protein